MRSHWLAVIAIGSTCLLPGAAGSSPFAPLVAERSPLESRAGLIREIGRGITISGTRFKVSSGNAYALNYPGACADLLNGTWEPRPTANPRDSTIIKNDTVGCTASAGCSGKDNNCCPPFPPCFPPATQCYVPTSLADVSQDDPDFCALDKNVPTDSAWVTPFPLTAPNATAMIQGCVFPVPAGTAALIVTWNHFLDAPDSSGYVQFAEFRIFKGGAWSTWRNSSPSGALRRGPEKAWIDEMDELPEAAQADSVQVRYRLQCVPTLAADGVNCSPFATVYYDDLGLFAITGVPAAPIFGIFQGALAQTTFVDGTMTGNNCTVVPCWPGPRGSNVVGAAGIHDNVNGVTGDSLVLSIRSPLRQNGMGVNWKQGFSSSVGGGLVIAHTNGAFNAALDQPRVIYRLFDPTNKVWSPFDSSGLDADDVQISAGDTTVVESRYRMDWPPRDKAGLNLPGGFTINGIAAYNSLQFLPRGTRLQYYFKAVDAQGNRVYQFQSDAAANEIQDLPALPGSSIVAPDIIEFDILPRVYPPGAVGSQLAGRATTPVLNLDGAYTAWSNRLDPVTQALRGLGVRADRYRLLQAVGYGANVGGHELTGPAERPTNYFPNMTDYSIRESLSVWYRIMIQSSHVRTRTLEDESDAKLLEEWWKTGTGTNQGDRCLFVSGDDYVNALFNPPAGGGTPERRSYAQDALGMSTIAGAWNGTASVLYPVVEDRFSHPNSGPGLVAGYTYPVDGGCPGPNRFDAFTKVGLADAQNAAFYPLFSGVTNVGSVAVRSEFDVPGGDFDRSKALSYGYSIQFVRKAGIPPTASSYPHSGINERMRILYKFLTGCRAAHSGGDICWPCPADTNMTVNWATSTGFNTGLYGPLYPIQDHTTITAVETAPEAAPGWNRIEGNYPNPFNPETTIRFSAARRGLVTLRIFNVGGQLLRTMTQKAEVGQNEIRWNGRRDDGTPLASGVYFYKIRFADGTESASRMAILR